ncbi:hypothetical protein BU17DRAFT_67560 [Hysterangium stoloniferum]|nr:hypothetical protein BU17DRAFT_67560 [Hysterangium stoloniferum]
MYRVHTLPTQPTKDTVEEEEEGNKDTGKSLRSALRQSRQTWLTSAFVKFSSKSRGGKGNDLWQPPHTIRLRGKCDLEIGPHVFYATSIYEVIYQPYSAPVQVPVPYVPPTQKTVTSPPLSTPPSTATVATTSGTNATVYAPSATALVSSLKGAIPITNELIAQVNSAAMSNPTLANLLGLAASGSATSEQLQTLGVTIQSLADVALKVSNGSTAKAQTTTSSTNVAPPSFTPSTGRSHAAPSVANPPSVLSLRPPQTSLPGTYPPQPQYAQNMQVIHKEPDVIIEFYENSYDRWILPKDLVLYEKITRWDGLNSLADIIFSTIFPFEGFKRPPATASTTEQPAETPKDVIHPITLRFFNVPLMIWNLFAPAAADEERTKRVQAAIDVQLDKAAPRTYLQHRIYDGALLTQLQASASDRYPMKGIKTSPATTGTGQNKRRSTGTPKDGSAAVKRKRIAPVKKIESRTGTCDLCKRASIVLAPDSPYCPPCKKKATGGITPVAGPSAGATPNDNTATTPQTPGQPIAPPAAPPAKLRKPKPKQAATSTQTVFRPSPYSAPARPSVSNYYTQWQQIQYAYYQHQATPSQFHSPGQGHIAPAQGVQPQFAVPMAAPINSEVKPSSTTSQQPSGTQTAPTTMSVEKQDLGSG